MSQKCGFFLPDQEQGLSPSSKKTSKSSKLEKKASQFQNDSVTEQRFDTRWWNLMDAFCYAFFQRPSIEENYFVGGALCQDPPALPAPEAEQSKEKEKPFCNFLQLSNFD